MQTIEHINSTFVRHNWKHVTDGLARGKTFIVENHGKAEAVVSAPESMEPVPDGLQDYFERIMARNPVPLARVEIQRGGEL